VIAASVPLRPKIKFPDSFQMGISTNEAALNITEVIYYDKTSKKIRMQLFYSVLGLEPTKGLDIVLDEGNGLIAIQSENDCKKTNFTDSLLPVNLFFSMFDQLTEYEGLDQDGLKQFKLMQFSEHEDSPKFYFLFDDNNTFTRSRLSQKSVGQYDFEATLPMEGRQFLDEDWYVLDNCPQIGSNVLKESGNFVSFMYSLVTNMIGSEDDLLDFLGYSNESNPLNANKYDGALFEDEDFD